MLIRGLRLFEAIRFEEVMSFSVFANLQGISTRIYKNSSRYLSKETVTYLEWNLEGGVRREGRGIFRVCSCFCVNHIECVLRRSISK